MSLILSEKILSFVESIRTENEASLELTIFKRGSENTIITQVLPPEICNDSSLIFATTLEQLALGFKNKAPLIVVLKNQPNLAALDAYNLNNKTSDPGPSILIAKNIAAAMTVILPFFDRKRSRFLMSKQVHPLASVHPTAKIGKNVSISAFSVINEDVSIGDSSIIGSHCILESGSRIGTNSLLHGFVFVGARCTIGDNCEIHPHTTIGSDGFGFLPTSQQPRKIPQLGNVEIGNHVEIGAGCTIDRATLTSTKIGHGTKMDNLVHIGHNCEMGANGLIAAGFMVAGSSKIGDHFMTGGNSVVTSHVTLTNHVNLAGRSTVTKDILQSGQYGGYPLQPVKEALKTLASLTHLTNMRRQISRILKKLDLTEEDI